MRDFARSDDPAVQAQLDRLGALSLPQGRLGLEATRELLARLGNPHLHLPPVFHVAGTNGKGSTCAVLRAIMEAAGLSVHVYTSPHLVRFNERIRVAGELISDAALAEVLAEVLDAAEAAAIPVSFFEVSTAAAFLAFARNPADTAIIEVGLGGRFDATNVLESPAACGIASLGIDHEAFLLSPDDTAPSAPYARIAFEKAGIAKRAAPLLAGTYTPAMNEAITQQAMKAGAPLIRRPYDWTATMRGKSLVYHDRFGTLKLPLPRLLGSHQRQNAALAIAMLRHQQAVAIPEAAFGAVAWTKWPARLQELGAGPLTTLLPPGTRCWLDGGHNPDAGRALADFFRKRGTPLHLVIGMLANKDAGAIIRALQFQLASVTVVPIPGHACHQVGAFADIPKTPAPQAAASVADALRSLTFAPQQQDVLIAGSLYLAGEVLKLNGEIPD